MSSISLTVLLAGIIGQTANASPPPPRADRHGDPLPAGARSRLGTVRFRHGGVYSLAFSPDGKKIAVSGHGRALTLWEVASGKELCRFPNRGQPNSVAFSADGKMLATMDFRSCYLFDAATGKELRRLGEQIRPRHVAFSPDGTVLAAGCLDGAVILWDSTLGKELRRLQSKHGEAERIAFSADGRLLASAGSSGMIALWDVPTGKTLRQWSAHKKTINGLAFSPKGKLLASASGDETLRLWDAATGRQVHVLGEKLSWSSAVAFSPDGKRLASGHHDGMIRLWDPAAGAEVRHWRNHSYSVRALAFSPDGQTLAAGGSLGCDVSFWDVVTGEERRASEGHHAPIQELRFSPDGRTLLSIAIDRQMLWWDVPANAIRRRFSWSSQPWGTSGVSKDTRTVVSDSAVQRELFAWDVAADKPGRLLGKHKDLYLAIAVSPDGRLAACGGIEPKINEIHVWDVTAGKVIKTIEGLTNPVKRLAFSPDGKRLVCGMRRINRGTEPAMRLWDTSRCKEVCRFNCFDSVWPLVFSADGKLLATGHDYQNRSGEYIGYVRLWDALTGKEIRRYEGGPEGVGSIAFSPDGKLVACGFGVARGEEQSVFHLWEAATGQLIQRFPCHHSGVRSLTFSPNGLTIASGGGDSTILLWDLIDRSRKSVPTPREMEAHWKALGDADAAKAYDGVWALIAAPEQALSFLQTHLRPVPRPDAKTIARLLKDLDSEEFAARRKAAEELSKYHDAIVPDLRKALEGKPTLEVRRRVQQMLDRAQDWTTARLREHRAIQVLEHLKARRLLEALAGGAAGSQRTEGARVALRRLIDAASPKQR